LDTSVWNLGLPAAGMAMLIGCGPIVGIGETDGETDTADSTDSDPSTSPETGPSTTSPSTTSPTTTATTSPTECFYDYDCPPGYRCDNGQCYYEGCADGCCDDGCCYEFGCYTYCNYSTDCQPGYQCHYNMCEVLQQEDACESVPFGIAFDIPVGGGVSSLAFIDADGTADRELLIGGDGLTLARVDGTTQQIAEGTYPYDLAVEDIDADGDRDIVMADGNSGGARVLVNDGAWTQIELSGTGFIESVVVADVYNDGFVDVIGASSGEGVFVWRNDGPGLWSDAEYVWDASYSVAGGDLDGDGYDDIISHNYTTYALVDSLQSVYELYNGTWGYLRQLGVGNFNGQGDLDVITTEWGNGGAVVTSFVGPVLQSSGFIATWWPYYVEVVEVADVNLDGYSDLIGGGPQLSIGFGGPEPDADTIVCLASIPTPITPYRVAAGDMSGDGRPDLAISDGGSVHVMLRTD
jgi:hypothetical protein